MELSIDNIRQHFSDLEFDEPNHKYYVNGTPIKCSVSGLIENYYEKFNKAEIALRVSLRDKRPVREVIEEWDAINYEAITRGTRVHLFGENYQFNRSLKPSCPQEEGIVKFWKDLPEHIISVGAELRMYHKKHLFAGTADILLFDTKTQTYIIADYKTNKDLYKNFKGKPMLSPFQHLLDNPLNHYQLQLSYYQILLEQLGIKVSKRLIIWLDMEGGYKMINTEDLTETLKATLN